MNTIWVVQQVVESTQIQNIQYNDTIQYNLQLQLQIRQGKLTIPMEFYLPLTHSS